METPKIYPGNLLEIISADLLDTLIIDVVFRLIFYCVDLFGYLVVSVSNKFLCCLVLKGAQMGRNERHLCQGVGREMAKNIYGSRQDRQDHLNLRKRFSGKEIRKSLAKKR